MFAIFTIFLHLSTQDKHFPPSPKGLTTTWIIHLAGQCPSQITFSSVSITFPEADSKSKKRAPTSKPFEGSSGGIWRQAKRQGSVISVHMSHTKPGVVCGRAAKRKHAVRRSANARHFRQVRGLRDTARFRPPPARRFHASVENGSRGEALELRGSQLLPGLRRSKDDS